jgi:hypothetical protein
MKDKFSAHPNIQIVGNFDDLVNFPFNGGVNAICWKRALQGNFEEIVHKAMLKENMFELNEVALLAMDLSVQGDLARKTILDDLQLLKANGALPVLNVIKHYERDEANIIFPTDVYSFHVDSAPVPSCTFLCTYYGESSELLTHDQAEQKVLVPSIREAIQKQNDMGADALEEYIQENFYDLHYQSKANASPISMGIGHIWRLAVAYPQSKVLPCIHRAPKEKEGQHRLLLIC